MSVEKKVTKNFTWFFVHGARGKANIKVVNKFVDEFEALVKSEHSYRDAAQIINDRHMKQSDYDNDKYIASYYPDEQH
jgi:hypothetical protein